jgi:hypothetical protein
MVETSGGDEFQCTVSDAMHIIGQKTIGGYMRINANIRDVTGKRGIPHKLPRHIMMRTRGRTT